MEKRCSTSEHGSGECNPNINLENEETERSQLVVRFLEKKDDSSDTQNPNPDMVTKKLEERTITKEGKCKIVPAETPMSMGSVQERLKSANDQVKRFTPSWQKNFLRLCQDVMNILERWETVFQKGSNSLAASNTPNATSKLTTSKHLLKLERHFEDNNVDISTLLYLSGLYISRIQPEPKEILTSLQTIFSSLSEVADLCVTILKIVSRTSGKQQKILGPLLKELKVHRDIIKDSEESEPSASKIYENKAFGVEHSSTGMNPTERTSNVSANLVSRPEFNVLTFILTSNRDVTMQYRDSRHRKLQEIKSSLKSSKTSQKITVIKLCLSEICEALNAGFKDIVELELNEPFKEYLFRVEHEVIPSFAQESKLLRSKHLNTNNCSHDLKIHLEVIYTKIMEQNERLNGIEKHARWILLALESLNHQRAIWSFPHEINHLGQAEKYGLRTDEIKKNTFLGKLRSTIFSSKTLTVCDKLAPFSKIFKFFQFNDEPDSTYSIRLSLRVENEFGKLLIGDDKKTRSKSISRAMSTKTNSENDLLTSTLFLSSSDIGLEQTVTGRRKATDKVLYLRQTPEVVSRANSSSSIFEQSQSRTSDGKCETGRDAPLSWVKNITDSERNLFWGRSLDPNKSKI